MIRAFCSYCGLPVAAARKTAEPIFCCYGCALVSRIVGGRDSHGQRAWNVLRLGIGALFAMNVMMISILLYTGRIEAASIPPFRWALLALATPAMALLGYPLLIGTVAEIARRRLSLDTLIAAGSFTAYGVSAANAIRGAGYLYFDTATMLPLLVTFGRLLEAAAKSHAGDLIRGLETLLPRTALRAEPEGPHEVALGELRPGDRILVRPGERIAADGRVLEGTTVIQEAEFTGESLPRTCGPGGSVTAGTVNGPGALTIHAERTGEDILLRRLIELAAEARFAVAPSERLANRAAVIFVPAVLTLALAAGVAWTAADGLARGALVALSVMVVACPCALVIAAPLTTALAIGRAARSGIVVRGGDVMERIGAIRTLCFDKTGTLTSGRFAAVRIEVLDQPAAEPDRPFPPSPPAGRSSTLLALQEVEIPNPVGREGLSPNEVRTKPSRRPESQQQAQEDELLAWLAGLESGSEHALGRAALAAARERGLDIGVASEVTVHPGSGIRGVVTRAGVRREVKAGTTEFVGDLVSDPPDSGETVVHVAWDGEVRGRVFLSDTLRPEAAAAIRQLHDAGIETVLLSGDRRETAEAIGAELGLDRVEAPRRPEEKIAFIRAASAGGVTVAMVGDGINDAPALASAPVGIALGAGTDLARQAGNVVLLSDRLTRIPWLVRLSRAARRTIAQNLLWAAAYNAVALAAAAAGVLHPLLAALAMVVSSLTVLASSLRLQRFEDG